MSCNGCRALRSRCSESCILRPCLQWIENPQAQASATLFVSKFFGRSDLMSFIAAVSENKRPALFQSLLFEACGRRVNPVNGAVGLLSTGNWHICQAAVQTVLSGGTLRPVVAGISKSETDEASKAFRTDALKLRKWYFGFDDDTKLQPSDLNVSAAPSFAAGRGGAGNLNCTMKKRRKAETKTFNSEESVMITFEMDDYGIQKRRRQEPKLLNLFV